MPVSKKKRTTAENASSMLEQAPLPMPEQQAFHPHLRPLAQSAVRTVLELVMREELDAFIGAAWGACSRQPKRLSQWYLHARSGNIHGAARRSPGSKTTVKVSSTVKSLTATVAMSHTLRDQPHADVDAMPSVV